MTNINNIFIFKKKNERFRSLFCSLTSCFKKSQKVFVFIFFFVLGFVAWTYFVQNVVKGEIANLSENYYRFFFFGNIWSNGPYLEMIYFKASLVLNHCFFSIIKKSIRHYYCFLKEVQELMIATRELLYKADSSIRRTVVLGTD